MNFGQLGGKPTGSTHLNIGEMFSVDLFKTVVAGRPGNAIMSPLSVFTSLSLLYHGASGETKAAMAQALGLEDLTDDVLAAEASELIRQFNGRDGEADIRLFNALWLREGITFADDFLNRSVESYFASLYNVNFADPNIAGLINDWVARASEGKISAIVETVSPQSLLMLTNAIYMKGLWYSPFSKSSTEPANFHLSDGTKIQVPTMNKCDDFFYCEGSDYQSVLLPYRGWRGSHSMCIILPSRETSVESFVRGLEPRHLSVQSFNKVMGSLKMPRFKIEFSCDLKPNLSSLGLGTIFDKESANFSAIALSNNQPFFVSEAIHKAMLTVDENGSEAAAATEISMAPGGIGPANLDFEMVVDRPFLVAICESNNRVLRILFTGVIVDPS